MDAVPVINNGYLFLSILLTLGLAVIWAIPSGPKCGKCETHLTEEFKLPAIRKSDNKEVIIRWTSCYRCKIKFNKYINNTKVNSFKDLDNE